MACNAPYYSEYVTDTSKHTREVGSMPYYRVQIGLILNEFIMHNIQETLISHTLLPDRSCVSINFAIYTHTHTEI